MYQIHPLTIYLYQSGLIRDDWYDTSPYTSHISHFARNSQVFIKAKQCAEHLEITISRYSTNRSGSLKG